LGSSTEIFIDLQLPKIVLSSLDAVFQRSVGVSSDVAKVTSFWSPAASATGSSHHRASSSSVRTTSSSSAGGTAVTGSTDGVASGRPRAESTSSPPAAAAARGSKLNANCLDKMSRLFFPTAFMVFNALYWGFYLYTASASLDDTK